MLTNALKKPVFYRCTVCGNLVEMLDSSGMPMMCCGRAMLRLEPNKSEGAGEKHVPVVTCEDHKVKVEVGALEHPMTLTHHIEWICLVTKCGIQRRRLEPDQRPEACFRIKKHDPPLWVLAYCNLHGLWEESIEDEE
ncbi:MAG: desulfoferrodoxin [Lachnospiraceae bacterium]|nr:desulfoferrodoxin [Candidatus Equihabitans merdae]